MNGASEENAPSAAAAMPRTSPPARRASPEASLLKICETIGSNLNLAEVLDTILEICLAEMSAQEGSILLRDDARDRLEMLASRGLPAEMTERGYIPRKGSIAEWVIEHDQPLILNGQAKGKDYASAPQQRRKIVSAMCLPLRANGRVIGTLNLNRTDESAGEFKKSDLKFMTIIASQAAVSIENARLHEAAVSAERLAAIGQTVAGVAHCVKNMLTSLRGGLSVCQAAETREDWSAFRQGSGILERAVNRVSSLALDMLEYSKDREPTLGDVCLPDLFRELAELKSNVAAQREIEIVSEIKPGAERARADSTQFFRCLLNLLENALDALANEGGRVTLSAEIDTTPTAVRKLSRKADRALVVRVADTGSGIPEEVAARIFDPFFSTKGSKGTGLGLAVTRKILREHGGEIELASAPGEPAVFAIYLPPPAADAEARGEGSARDQ